MNTRTLSAKARRAGKRQARKDRRLGLSPSSMRRASAVTTIDGLRTTCQTYARSLQMEKAALWDSAFYCHPNAALDDAVIVRLQNRLADQHRAMTMWMEWSNDHEFLRRWCARINRYTGRRERREALRRDRIGRSLSGIASVAQDRTIVTYLQGLTTRDVQ